MNLSASLENYLETMLFLSEDKEVRLTDIANKMCVSKASVNKAVNQLKDLNLLNHSHYGSISFTEEGYNIAKSIARKHSILLEFFTKVLNIDEDTALLEACEIEHILSNDTVSAIEKYCLSKENSL